MTTDPSTWEVEAGQSEIRGQLKRYLRPYLTRTKNIQNSNLQRLNCTCSSQTYRPTLFGYKALSRTELDYAYSFPEDQA